VDDVDRIVGQWAQERPELQTDAMAVFGRIYRLARVVGDRQERVYSALGINRGEFDVLATLRRAGEPFQLSPKALSHSLMLTTGGMTGRLDRLERAGLVARSPDPADRRSLVITLTPRGREVIDEAVVAGLDAQREVLERLPETSRRRLSALLRDLLAAAES
jgi:DNA-binding MarR family transcriptional regulator